MKKLRLKYSLMAIVSMAVIYSHLIPIKRLRYLSINSTDLGVLSVSELSMDLPIE